MAAALLGIVPAADGQPEPVWTSAGNPALELELTTRVGSMGPEPIPVHDGYVRVGSWDLERLSPREKAPYVFYLARVPLDFDLEEGGRFVRRVTVTLRLADGCSHVRALFPEKVRDRTEGMTRFVSRDYLFFPQAGTDAIRKLDLRVEPVVDGSGAGSDKGKWNFTSEGNIGVRRGDRTVFLIVAAPPAQQRLEVTATAQIDIGREMLGIRYDDLSEISSQSFAIGLPDGDGGPGAEPGGCGQGLAEADTREAAGADAASR